MKREKIGTTVLILGLLLIAAALALFLYNRADASRADRAAQELLEELDDVMPSPHPPVDTIDSEEAAMPVLELPGGSYIGVLEIPSLGLRLPVAESWSYAQLRVSPCRYSGSWHTGDLVICAHNYAHHFSPIKWISVGAEVTFVAADGTMQNYTVLSRETVRPTAISEMVDNQANSESSADWDLTLFTCNTGGQTRCAVRCALVNP